MGQNARVMILDQVKTIFICHWIVMHILICDSLPFYFRMFLMPNGEIFGGTYLFSPLCLGFSQWSPACSEHYIVWRRRGCQLFGFWFLWLIYHIYTEHGMYSISFCFCFATINIFYTWDCYSNFSDALFLFAVSYLSSLLLQLIFF